MTESLLDAALRYAAAGWPVFPCRPGAKEPLTAHGFKDASTDPATIRVWWSRTPSANVAIATGAPAVDVLDVDLRPSGSGFPAMNRLRREGLLAGARAYVRTPSGGAHVYFDGTDRSCGSLPGLHLDLKARGGYVLAPTSAVNGRSYCVMLERPGGGVLDWPAVRRLFAPPVAQTRVQHRGPPEPGSGTWPGGWPSSRRAPATPRSSGPPAEPPRRATVTSRRWAGYPWPPGCPRPRCG